MLAPIGPDQCHALAVRRNARYLTRLYDGHLSSAGLSVSQFSLLSLIEYHGQLRIAGLAVLMDMERTTLLRALKPLLVNGWLDNDIVGGTTARVLSLSSDGVAKLVEAAPLWKKAQRAFEGEVGRDRALQLRTELLGIHFERHSSST